MGISGSWVLFCDTLRGNLNLPGMPGGIPLQNVRLAASLRTQVLSGVEKNAPATLETVVEMSAGRTALDILQIYNEGRVFEKLKICYIENNGKATSLKLTIEMTKVIVTHLQLLTVPKSKEPIYCFNLNHTEIKYTNFVGSGVSAG